MGLLLLIFSACGDARFRYQTDPTISAIVEKDTVYPRAAFVVLSDIHYYSTALGTQGDAFGRDLQKDRKLLVESAELLNAAVDAIAETDARFVIVCGDLTKDGARLSHMGAQQALLRLADAGIPVFVVPGNHDVANGLASRYDGARKIPVPNVTAGEFADIYSGLGYAAALRRDAQSLSYVVEPLPGLWLLGLDSCRWRENRPGSHAVTGGAFSRGSLDWVEAMLIEAKKSGKAVIAFLHHGVLPHYPGNGKYFERYLVADHQTLARLLARYGVRMVFTGHFHAQDITLESSDGPDDFLLDIETGSLVTHPCPYRMIRIDADQTVTIQSRHIRSLPSRPTDFVDYSERFLFASTLRQVDRSLSKYGVPREDRIKIAPWVTKAYVAHLSGDEKRPAQIMTEDGLGSWARLVVWWRLDLVEGWWTDLPPADNRIRIDLVAGQVLSFENTGD